MTNSKLRNSDPAYSMSLVKFIKIVYFLDNHRR